MSGGGEDMAGGAAPVVRIATRSSELALRQARLVQRALAGGGIESELVPFRTTGDKHLDEPLHAIGAKGLFTQELEQALRRGRVDCCVHSLKDLPTDSPPELELVALLEREDPRDVLLVSDAVAATSIDELPRGTRVGTSSLRRRAQLLHRRPDVEVVELRGNVPTRVRKVDDGQVHAAILAAAGLLRLEIHQRIDAWLEAPAWLPAAGQGVIAVQARADDVRMRSLLTPLDHLATRRAATAERAVLAALGGGCQVPIGALVMAGEGGLTLHAMVASPGGTHLVRGDMAVDAADPAAAGRALADELLGRSAGEILSAIRESDRPVPAPQPE